MDNEERILCEYQWRIISRITYDYMILHLNIYNTSKEYYFYLRIDNEARILCEYQCRIPLLMITWKIFRVFQRSIISHLRNF